MPFVVPRRLMQPRNAGQYLSAYNEKQLYWAYRTLYDSYDIHLKEYVERYFWGFQHRGAALSDTV
jgi:hypothetical protein